MPPGQLDAKPHGKCQGKVGREKTGTGTIGEEKGHLSAGEAWQSQDVESSQDREESFRQVKKITFRL